MKVSINRVPAQGIKFEFTEKDSWVSQALGRFYRPGDSVKGRFEVYETVRNLSVIAQIRLPIHANCARCLEPFDRNINLQIRRILVPKLEAEKGSPKNSELKKITLEDENFSFYEGSEIDVGQIISEQVALEQPMIDLCRPGCKGLCSRCGVNRNLKPCSCEAPTLEKSPFAALKALKKDLH